MTVGIIPPSWKLVDEQGNITEPWYNFLKNLATYATGPWTPTLTTDGTNFASVTYDETTGGSYVRLGKLVHVQAALMTDAVDATGATGAVHIGGLPFRVTQEVDTSDEQWASVVLGFVANWTINPIGGLFMPGSKTISLYETVGNAFGGNFASLDVADVGTGTNDNQIYFSGCYITDE